MPDLIFTFLAAMAIVCGMFVILGLVADLWVGR